MNVFANDETVRSSAVSVPCVFSRSNSVASVGAASKKYLKEQTPEFKPLVEKISKKIRLQILSYGRKMRR